MAWWLALLPHKKRVVGLNPAWGLSVWSLYVFSRYSSFLPQSKNMNEVQLIVDSKVTVDVIGCLSLCVILAAVCQSVQG